MYWDWFWIAFTVLWAILIIWKLFYICKRRNMANERQRQQQAAMATHVTVGGMTAKGYFTASCKIMLLWDLNLKGTFHVKT